MLKRFVQTLCEPVIATLAPQGGLGHYKSPGSVVCKEPSPVGQKLDDKLAGKFREALNGLFQITVAGLGSKDADNEFEYLDEGIRTATGQGARELQKTSAFVYARDPRWMMIYNFDVLHSLGASSVEPPMFLEHNFCSDPIPSTKPCAVIGQGTTFNSGGLCHEMMADMASTALNLGAFTAVAATRPPINMRAFKPLYEKLVSGNAMKVGDTLRINDPVLRTENTQNHSQLLMAEVLTYATKAVAAMWLLINKRAFITLYEKLVRGNEMKVGDALRINDRVLRTENTQNHSQLLMAEVLTYATKAVAAMWLLINKRAFITLYEKLVRGNEMKVGDALRINDRVLRTENTQNHSQLLMAEVLTYATKAVAAMWLLINKRAFITLYEKLVRGNEMKVGDALRINDRVLRTENTQNHSQLLMAEVLTYATKVYSPKLVLARSFSTSSACQRGLVLGVYENPDDVHDQKLTTVGQKLDDKLGGKLRLALNRLPGRIMLGGAGLVNDVCPEFPLIAIAGLGPKPEDLNWFQYQFFEANSKIKIASGVGARLLQMMGVQDIAVEGFNNPTAAAEGATLGVWSYNDKEVKAKVSLYEDGDLEDWERGVIMADSQNMVRSLCKNPAKHLNPRILTTKAQDLLFPYGVYVHARDTLWMKAHNLNNLLMIGTDSDEPPLVLELYYGNDPIPSAKPHTWICQGTSLISGHIFNERMHRDISSTAIILGVFKAVAAMRLRISMRAFILLYKNNLGDCKYRAGETVLINNAFWAVNNPALFAQREVLAEAFINLKKIYSLEMVYILGDEHVGEFKKQLIRAGYYPGLFSDERKHTLYFDVHESNDINYLSNKLYTGTHTRKLIQEMWNINYKKEQDRAADKMRTWDN